MNISSIFLEVNMDFLAHIEENRNEVIAIPFNGWIKNIGEMMVKYILSTGKIYEWNNKYPFIKDITMMLEQRRLFNTTSFYTSLSFLNAMYESNRNVPRTELQADYSEMMSYLNPKSAAITNMEIIIIRLLEEAFVKKIYIYSPWFSPEIRDYINRIITKNKDKVYLIESDLIGTFKNNPDITTMFVDEVEDLMRLIQMYPDHANELNGKFFVISANPSITKSAKEALAKNIEIDKIKDMYKYQDYMKTLKNRFNSDAVYIKQILPKLYYKIF